MIERLARLVLLALVWVAASAMGGQTPPPAAEKRVALVIGNGAYTQTVPLKNPANDARAIAEALRRIGFEVIDGIDLNYGALRRSIRTYGEQLPGADIAVFFYAGHGVQVAGENYLIPTDATLASETDLDFATVAVDLVLKQMDRYAKTKIIILDACRNNPFEAEMARAMGVTRAAGLGRGLARIDATGGSLISYATAPGAVAADGEGEHSPFTQALLRHLETPGLKVEELMTKVRTDVHASTGARQRPWTSNSLIGEVYLTPPSVEPAPAPVAPPAAATAPAQTPAPQVKAGPGAQEIEMEIWRSAERGGLKADYESYLRKYPDGLFADLAKNRIAALSKDATAPATATPPTSGGGTPANQPYQAPQPFAAGPSPADAEAALGMTRDDRAAIQSLLSMQGYDTRGVDGVFGAGSRAAIREWQSDEGFAPTGYLDMEQIEQLVSGAEPGMQNWATGQGAGGFATPTFNAYAYCSMTGAEGYASGVDPNQALWEAVNACIYNGGVPQCCANGARLLQ